MNGTVRWAAALVVAWAGFVTLPGRAEAQRPPGAGNPNRAELERRVQARFGQMMKERLGLSDAEADRLSRTVESFAPRRREIVLEEQAVRRSVEALVLRPGAVSDAEARDLLARMEGLRERELRLYQEEQEALLEVLSPAQLVRFHGMRAQLGDRIRQLRGGQGPAGAGQGGPPWRRPPGGDPWDGAGGER